MYNWHIPMDWDPCEQTAALVYGGRLPEEEMLWQIRFIYENKVENCVKIDCCEEVNYFCAQVTLLWTSHQIPRSKLETCRSDLTSKALHGALLVLPRAGGGKPKVREQRNLSRRSCSLQGGAAGSKRCSDTMGMGIPGEDVPGIPRIPH